MTRDAHAKLQVQRSPLPERLRLGAGERGGLYLQSYPLSRVYAKLPGLVFRNGTPTTRFRTCRWNGRMPAGAYDREASLCAVRGMVERIGSVEKLGFDWVRRLQASLFATLPDPVAADRPAYIA